MGAAESRRLPLSPVPGEMNWAQSWVPLKFQSLIDSLKSQIKGLPSSHAMKIRTASLLVLLLGWIVQPLIAAEPLALSLVQLIANPQDYDGKLVRVIGFVRLEFEGNAIYLHQDDYKHVITKNGLWLDASGDIVQKREEFDQKYVLLEGVFNAKNTGHMGLWSGSIQKISRCKVWMERDGKK